MSWHRWVVFGLVALPVLGFSLWLLGQFLNARREETEAVLRKGLRGEAEILSYDGSGRSATVEYRFTATGWENPITVTKRVSADRKFSVGEKVEIRYLPGHPYISVIVSRES
jgi:hypothetical protein